MLLPGNCLCGAVLLWLRFGGRIKRMRKGHYFVRTPRDGSWHFTVKRDLLPDRLAWIVFLGRFERLRDKKA